MKVLERSRSAKEADKPEKATLTGVKGSVIRAFRNVHSSLFHRTSSPSTSTLAIVLIILVLFSMPQDSHQAVYMRTVTSSPNWTGNCAATACTQGSPCRVQFNAAITLIPEVGGGCTIVMLPGGGSPGFQGQWNALALRQPLYFDISAYTAATEVFRLQPSSSFTLSTPIMLSTAVDNHWGAASQEPLPFNFRMNSNYDWKYDTIALHQIAGNAAPSETLFNINTNGSMPALRVKLSGYYATTYYTSSTMFEFSGPTEEVELMLGEGGVQATLAATSTFMSTSSSTSKVKLTLNGASSSGSLTHTITGKSIFKLTSPPSNTVTTIQLNSANARIGGSTAIIETTSSVQASFALSQSRLAPSSPLPKLFSAASNQGIVLNMTGTAGNRFSGFNLTGAAYYGHGNITNCIFKPSSTVFSTFDTRIAYDTSDSSYTTLLGNPSASLPAANNKFSGASLELSKERFLLEGPVALGDASSSECSLRVQENKILRLSTTVATTITSRCSLNLVGGVSGSDTTSKILGSVPEQSKAIEMDISSNYDVSIDLSNFDVLIVSSSFTATPFNRSLINSAGTMLKMTGKPATGTKILWPASSPDPVENTPYYLYETTEYSEIATPAIYSPTQDLFRFETFFQNISSNVVALAFRLMPTPPPLAPIVPETPPQQPSVPETPIQPPETEHETPIDPIAPPTVPPTPYEASVVYSCVDSICQYNGSVVVATLIVLPRALLTNVLGNLSTSSIVLQKLGSAVNVSGCAYGVSSVELQLTQADIDAIEKGKRKTQTLLTTASSEDGSACPPINNVGVSIKLVGKSGCKKIKTEKAKQTKNNLHTLSVVLTVDSSKCNLWWIILASVLGGVIVLGIVVIIAVVACVPSLRAKIRPFAGTHASRTR